MNQQIDLNVLSKARLQVSPGADASPVPFPKSRWKTRVLLPGAILFAFAAMLAYTARDALWPATPVRVMPVVLKSSAGSVGSVSFQAAGWVEPDPFPTYVAAQIDGVVKEVLVLEGQRIESGQIVARLIDDEFKMQIARQEAELRHHQADLAVAEAALTAAQSDWENAIERKRAVAAAEGMSEQIAAEIKHLSSEIAVEQARAAELEEQLKRESAAVAVNAIPEIQAVQTRLKLATQNAVLQSARYRQPVLEAKLKQQQADLQAARDNAKLRIEETKALAQARASQQVGAAVVGEAMAELKMANLRVQRSEIRAPVSGTVLQRYAAPGDKVAMAMNEQHSSHIISIYDPNKLQVRVDVPLVDAAKIGVGQKAKIAVEVLRDTFFDGVITRVVHTADIQKNTLQVKVAIEKPAPELKPEMLARVQFIASATPAGNQSAVRERAFAHESTLRINGNQAEAWAIDKGRGVVMKRTVTVGSTRMEGWVEVTDGLLAGDALISSDRSQLRDGQRVRIESEDNVGSGASAGGGAHGSH